MSFTWEKYRKERFLVLTILLTFPSLCVGQDEKGSLMCWECDSAGSGGTCTGQHEGRSVLCPPEDPKEYPPDKDVDTPDAYKCWIMKVESESNMNIEIMKGCSNIAYQFIKESETEFVPYQTTNGCSNTTFSAFIVGETKRWYRIRMCFCNDKNDCNKHEIDGVGKEDIYLRQKRAHASSLFRGSSHINILCVVQLLGLVASGHLLGFQ